MHHNTMRVLRRIITTFIITDWRSKLQCYSISIIGDTCRSALSILILSWAAYYGMLLRTLQAACQCRWNTIMLSRPLTGQYGDLPIFGCACAPSLHEQVPQAFDYSRQPRCRKPARRPGHRRAACTLDLLLLQKHWEALVKQLDPIQRTC